MLERVESRLADSGLSRRTVVGLLSGASILGSRAAGDLLSAAVELLDVGIAALTVYQTTVGEGLLGLYLSWFLAGYLIYAYIPELNIDYFVDVVESRVYRAITAVFAVYWGVLWAKQMGNLPSEGIFSIVPSKGPDFLLALIAGVLGAILAFGVYDHIAHPVQFPDANSKLFDFYLEHKVYSQRIQFERIETLSRPTRSLLTFVLGWLAPSFFLPPSFLLGLVLGFVNGYQPLPELLVFLTSVLSFIPSRWQEQINLLSESTFNIEFFTANIGTRTYINFKGLILGTICLCGLLSSALPFFSGLGFFVRTIDRTILFIRDLANSGGIPLSDVPTTLATLWFIIASSSTLPVYSLYGLIYWVQQFKRLLPYIGFWEQYWQGLTREPPPTSSGRPPGLFVPGNILLLLIGVFLWLTQASNPSVGLILAYCIGWFIVIAIIGWSLYETYFGEVQPLDNEGRDVIITYFLQILSVSTMGLALGIEMRNVIVLVGAAVVMVGLGYLPEVTLYAERRVGAVSYLGVVYIAILVTFTLFIGEIWTRIPTTIYIFFAILLLAGLLFVYLGERVASLDRE